MSSMSFSIAGSVGLQVVITDLGNGSVRFDLQNQGTQVGDLRGLFFDLNDASLLSTLSVSGAAVTKSAFGDDAVINLGNGVNMNGAGTFDVGVAFGTSGIGKDDISATSFVLTSSSGALDLGDFAGADFGVRFTSVGDLGGARDDSLKLIGEAPPLVVDPGPIGGPIGLPPPEVVIG